MDTEREKLLKEIMALDFALLDMNLYLDTHPNDTQVLNSYKKYLDKSCELRQKYQEKYGPLTPRYVSDNKKWNWIDNPWPWDGKEE